MYLTVKGLTDRPLHRKIKEYVIQFQCKEQKRNDLAAIEYRKDSGTSENLTYMFDNINEVHEDYDSESDTESYVKSNSKLDFPQFEETIKDFLETIQKAHNGLSPKKSSKVK